MRFTFAEAGRQKVQLRGRDGEEMARGEKETQGREQSHQSISRTYSHAHTHVYTHKQPATKRDIPLIHLFRLSLCSFSLIQSLIQAA